MRVALSLGGEFVVLLSGHRRAILLCVGMIVLIGCASEPSEIIASPALPVAATQQQGPADALLVRLPDIKKMPDTDAELGNEWLAVSAFTQSPDGKLLAWGDGAGSVWVHSFASKQASIIRDNRRSHVLEEGVLALAFDGNRRLLWLEAEPRVMAASTTGATWTKPRRAFTFGGRYGQAGVLRPDVALVRGARLVGFRSREVVLRRDLKTGNGHVSNALFLTARGVNAFVKVMCVSFGKKLLFVVCFSDCALLRLPDLKILRRFGKPGGRSAALSPKGTHAALGTYSDGIFVWNTDTGALVTHVSVTSDIWPIVFVSESVLYYGAWPGIHRLDLRTGASRQISADGGGAVFLLSASRTSLLVGGRRGGIREYRLPAIDSPAPSDGAAPTEQPRDTAKDHTDLK